MTVDLQQQQQQQTTTTTTTTTTSGPERKQNKEGRDTANNSSRFSHRGERGGRKTNSSSGSGPLGENKFAANTMNTSVAVGHLKGVSSSDKRKIQQVAEFTGATADQAWFELQNKNGDVQAAISSLLDNPFEVVKTKTQKQKERPQRSGGESRGGGDGRSSSDGRRRDGGDRAGGRRGGDRNFDGRGPRRFDRERQGGGGPREPRKFDRGERRGPRGGDRADAPPAVAQVIRPQGGASAPKAAEIPAAQTTSAAPAAPATRTIPAPAPAPKPLSGGSWAKMVAQQPAPAPVQPPPAAVEPQQMKISATPKAQKAAPAKPVDLDTPAMAASLIPASVHVQVQAQQQQAPPAAGRQQQQRSVQTTTRHQGVQQPAMASVGTTATMTTMAPAAPVAKPPQQQLEQLPQMAFQQQPQQQQSERIQFGQFGQFANGSTDQFGAGFGFASVGTAGNMTTMAPPAPAAKPPQQQLEQQPQQMAGDLKKTSGLQSGTMSGAMPMQQQGYGFGTGHPGGLVQAPPGMYHAPYQTGAMYPYFQYGSVPYMAPAPTQEEKNQPPQTASSLYGYGGYGAAYGAYGMQK